MSFADLHEAFGYTDDDMRQMATASGEASNGDEFLPDPLGWRLATPDEFKQFVHARFGRLFNQAVIEMEFEHYCKVGVSIHDYMDFMDDKR